MEEKKEIQIELSAEVAEGIYSNLAIISHAPSEFVIDFIRMTPGAPKAPVKSQTIVIRLAGQHTQIRSSIRAYTNERSSTGRYASFHGSRRGSLTTDRRRILSNSLSFRV